MKNLLIGFILIISLNSCATLIGGSKYYANINVISHPKAEVYRDGMFLGVGSASTTILRTDAARVYFNVKEEGFEDQSFYFRQRLFRGWAFAGTTIVWGYLGMIVDAVTGAIWKPNHHEPGVKKLDFMHYEYNLVYLPKSIIPEEEEFSEEEERPIAADNDLKTKEQKLRDLKNMVESGIIDSVEYKELKRRILEIEDDEILTEEVKENIQSKATESDTINSTQKLESDKTPQETTKSESTEKKVETTTLSTEDQEKLNDLNKMLELGIISQTEYNEMKTTLIDKKSE